VADYLEVELRPEDGKGKLRKVREAGRVPGVVYGGYKPNLNVQFDRKPLEHIISHSGRGMNTLFEIRLKSDKGLETDTVMARELQRDPVYRRLRHADFYRISMSERITTEVHLAMGGEPVGVKEGGRLQPFLRSLRIECLPAQIPNAIEVKVDELRIGDRLTVADLKLPAEIRVLHDPDEPVAGVAAAKEDEAAAPKPEMEPEAAAEGRGKGPLPEAAK